MNILWPRPLELLSSIEKPKHNLNMHCLFKASSCYNGVGKPLILQNRSPWLVITTLGSAYKTPHIWVWLVWLERESGVYIRRSSGGVGD